MWILTIRDTDGSWNGRGPAVSTHESEVAAEEALAAYVKRNWNDEEMGHTFEAGFEGVSDPATAESWQLSDPITEYFETTPGETFTITRRSDAR
jgi:hypothetical protein